MINTQYTSNQGLQFWKDTLWDDLYYNNQSQEHKDFLIEVLAPVAYYVLNNSCVGRYGTSKLGKIIHSRIVSIINYFALNSKSITKEQKQNLLEVFYWYTVFQKVIFYSSSSLKDFTPLKEVYTHLKVSMVAAEMSTNGKDKQSFYDLVRRASYRYIRGEVPNGKVLSNQAQALIKATQEHLREKAIAAESSKTLKDVVVNFFQSPAFVRIGLIRAVSAPAANVRSTSVDIMISNISLKNVLENKPIGYLAPTPRNAKATYVLGLYLEEGIKEAQHLLAVEKLQLESDQTRVAYLLSQMTPQDRDLLERYFKNKLI